MNCTWSSSVSVRTCSSTLSSTGNILKWDGVYTFRILTLIDEWENRSEYTSDGDLYHTQPSIPGVGTVVVGSHNLDFPDIDIGVVASTPMSFITSWGSNGTGDGEFVDPDGIAIDTGDNIYIADRNNHRIQKFDSAGNFSFLWGSNGSGNGQFSDPSGIEIDSVGQVYVVDRNNHRIQKFSSGQ